MARRLSTAERRFLALIREGGSIASGTTTGYNLYAKGMVELTQYRDRYQITADGVRAIADYPESAWKMPQTVMRARSKAQ